MLREKLKDYKIILASGSPRRHQFLMELDIPFTVEQKPVKEVYPVGLKGAEITNFLAKLKAETFLKDLKEKDILITSDTIVWLNDKALGKPETAFEAQKMLESLSGTTHKVITSVTFTTRVYQKTLHSTTSVSFRKLRSDEIAYYIDNYKPFDKAGAYGIQEWIGLVGITRIEGSYFNVVGLPTHMVYNTLLEIASR